MALGNCPTLKNWVAISIFIDCYVSHAFADNGTAVAIKHIDLVNKVMLQAPCVVCVGLKGEPLACLWQKEFASIFCKLCVVIYQGCSPKVGAEAPIVLLNWIEDCAIAKVAQNPNFVFFAFNDHNFVCLQRLHIV